MDLEAMREKINHSPVFGLNSEMEASKYQKSALELVEDLYIYLNHLSNKYADMGLEIVETTYECLRNYHADYGTFLNYFLSSIRKRANSRIAKQQVDVHRGGIVLSESEKRKIRLLNNLSKALHLELTDKLFWEKAAVCFGTSTSSIQALVDLNSVACTVSSDSNEKTSFIIGNIPSPLSVEQEVEDQDILITYMNSIEKRYNKCQDRQKPVIAKIMTAKLLKDFPDFIEYLLHNQSYSFLDKQVFSYFKQTGLSPTAREISTWLGRNEASVSRTFKSFLTTLKCESE